MLHPLLVVEVPVDGQDDALLEGSLGIPAKVVLDLGGVDAIAAVMAQTVSDVLDESSLMPSSSGGRAAAR